MKSQLVKAKNGLNRLAALKVMLPNRNEVEKYLANYPELGPVVVPVCKRARVAFGPAAELSLEVYSDPEVEDHYLTLYVRPSKYEPNIFDRIEAVSTEFAEQLDASSGNFLGPVDVPALKLEGLGLV